MSERAAQSVEEFEQRIRRALKTPPISNEEIVRQSKSGRKPPA